MHGVADGVGDSRVGGGGATGRWGAIVGGQQWGVGGVSSTSKNRPSHQKYKYESPKQFELKQS